VTEQIDIGIQQAIADIDTMRGELRALQNDMSKVEASGKGIFTGTTTETQKLAQELAEARREMAGATAEARKQQAAFQAGASATSSMAQGVTQAASGTEKLTLSQRALNLVMRANPIMLVVTAVGVLIGAMSRLQPIVDLIARVTAVASQALSVLTDRIYAAGVAIVNGSWGDFKSALSGIGTEIVSTSTKAYELEKRIQALRDANIESAAATAKSEAAIAKLKSAGEDETLSSTKRLQSLRQAAVLEADLQKQRIAAARETADIAKEQAALQTNNLQAKEDAARAEVLLIEAEADAERSRLDLQKQQREIYEQRRREREQAEKEMQKLRLETIADGIEKEIAAEDERHKNLIEGLKKYNLDTSAEIERHEKNVFDIRLKYYLQGLEQQREAARREDPTQADGQDELTKADIEAKARAKAEGEAAIALRNQDAKYAEARFEAALLQGRKLFFSKKRTDQERAEYEKEAAKAREVFQLSAQAAELQRVLDFNKELSEAERAELETRVKNLQEQADQVEKSVGEKKKDKPFSIYSLFGLDPDTDKAAISALEQAKGQLINSIEQVTASRVEAAEAVVEAADREIEARENALNREIELAQLGFSSNVSLRQQELEDARKNRAIALSEQQKAARAQLAVDAAQQASSIAVSVAQLIKTWSTLPFGVGLIAAFAQAASIVAFIASVRNRAKAINAQQFRHGGDGYVNQDGVIVGASHEQGGVKVPEYEDGEFFTSDGKQFAVVNRKMTKTHFGLLRAINRDDRVSMADYLHRMTGGIHMNMEATGRAAESSSTNTIVLSDPEARRLLEENNRLTRRLVELEQERETLTDMGTHYLRKKGGRTERINK